MVRETKVLLVGLGDHADGRYLGNLAPGGARSRRTGRVPDVALVPSEPQRPNCTADPAGRPMASVITAGR